MGYKTERLTDLDTKLMVTKEEKGGGGLSPPVGFGTDMCTPLYIK